MSYWAIAGDPHVYEVVRSVKELDEDWWRTADKPLAIGDRVAIWKYKGNDTRRGVVALGEIVEGPTERDERDSRYWIGQGGANLGESAPRVLVHYVRPAHLPIWSDSSPGTVANELSVSRAHGGTTLIITDDQWHRLVAEAGGWPIGDRAEKDQTILAVEEAIHPGRHGQGRLDRVGRRAIELHAMKVVRDDYERRRWSVEDVSANHPYDLHCQRDDMTERVEVKGTTGGLDTVFLTSGEVRSARSDPEPSTLAVVHGIQLDRSSEVPKASAGTLWLKENWGPEEDDLIPIVFTYRLPTDPPDRSPLVTGRRTARSPGVEK